MHTGDPLLWDIVVKAATGGVPSVEELLYAEAALGSPVALDRANACEAILRRSTLKTQRTAALTVLESLCLASENEDYVVVLLNAMLYARNLTFRNPSRMRDFVLRSVRSPKAPIRTNAVELVEQLARAGDRQSLDALRALTRDPDSNVRSNAIVSLRNLGASADS